MTYPGAGRTPILLAGATSEVVSLLRPYAAYILPAVFVGFFVAAAIAVGLDDRWHARQSFVACFFVALLLFNFVVPVPPLPFRSWSHFAEPTAETETYSEFRLVDESGQEIRMDSRITIGFDTISAGSLRRSMRTEYSAEKNEEIALWLLLRAEEYRAQVGERSVVNWLRYPPHSLTGAWTEDLLEEYGSFVGVRIYEMTFVTSDDGTELEQYEETVVFESFPRGRQPTGDPPSAMPTRSMQRTVLNSEAPSRNRTDYATPVVGA